VQPIANIAIANQAGTASGYHGSGLQRGLRGRIVR
jgi:hypothetical protein